MHTYQDYLDLMHRIADLRYASAVLQWDQETYLPEKGADRRGQQIATLSEMSHELFTQPKNLDLLTGLENRRDLSDKERRNVQLTLQDYQDQTKFSPAFVRTLSEAVQKSFHSWMKARQENNFKFFEADLQDLIQLKKEEAAMAGFKEHPYDALLDQHDKGSCVSLLDPIFQQLESPLKSLLDAIAAQPQVNNDFLFQHFPDQDQWALGIQIIEELGYDLKAGRQDRSEHPFTTNFNNKDVRVTTRVDEHDLSNMLWSCIHEAGHALYEQGLPDDQYGLPLGEPVSYSIHESQSRLWENHVGRSRAFCNHYFPLMLQKFPEALKNIDALDFYKAINKVTPSLIRTEADEITYHFHVMIRYEIEKELIGGKLQARHIPEAWNHFYKKYLGVDVPDDKRGCLQDVHWSHGSFGYFPTYSMGSFYAAQFFNQAKRSIPDLDNQIQHGQFAPLLQWLRTAVHQHGRYYNSEELCKKITGEGLNIQYFMDQMQEKYKAIYNF